MQASAGSASATLKHLPFAPATVNWSPLAAPWPVKDFYERFESAFAAEMAAFVSACRGEQPLTLTLDDALEATRIGLAITSSLHSGLPESI